MLHGKIGWQFLFITGTSLENHIHYIEDSKDCKKIRSAKLFSNDVFNWFKIA